MKKHIAMTAAIIMGLSMTACGKSSDESSVSETVTIAPVSETTIETTTTVKEVKNSDVTTTNEKNTAPKGVKNYCVRNFVCVDDIYSIALSESDDYSESYNVTVEDYFLADALGKLSSYFTIRTDASSGKLGDYEIIDKDGRNLGMMSSDELRNTFDPTVKYEVIDWYYGSEVYLSTLEEGVLYRTAVTDLSPVFVNDTDTDYVVWIMNDYDYTEKAYTYPLKQLEGVGRADKDIYLTGDNVYVRIEKLTPSILKPHDPSLPASFVNGHHIGEQADIEMADIMVNASSDDVYVEIQTYDGNVINTVIEGNAVYAIDGMRIEHILITDKPQATEAVQPTDDSQFVQDYGQYDYLY